MAYKETAEEQQKREDVEHHLDIAQEAKDKRLRIVEILNRCIAEDQRAQIRPAPEVRVEQILAEATREGLTSVEDSPDMRDRVRRLLLEDYLRGMKDTDC